METTPSPQYALISDCSRTIVGLSGFALIGAAALVFWFPPTRTTRETNNIDGDPKVTVKETTTDADPSATAAVMLITGAALLAFGINGVKLSKFSSSVLSVESSSLPPAAQQSQTNAAPVLPNGQVDGLGIVREYLNLSSWNGIKVIYIAMRASQRGAFNFRDLCSQDSRMSHDYAFAYLVASSSLGLFPHSSDAGGVMVTVGIFPPVVNVELTAVIERRYSADPIDAPIKRAEIARIDAFFAAPAR